MQTIILLDFFFFLLQFLSLEYLIFANAFPVFSFSFFPFFPLSDFSSPIGILTPPLLPPQAIELKEDFRSALFNLALLLTDDMRPLEAAPFLNQLVKHHPDHVKGLILLGDIYINNIKDLDAAEKVWREGLLFALWRCRARGSRCRLHTVIGDVRPCKRARFVQIT